MSPKRKLTSNDAKTIRSADGTMIAYEKSGTLEHRITYYLTTT